MSRSVTKSLDLFALISAILFILSFPPFSFWPLAFFAFIPLFYSAGYFETYRSVFFNFFLAGFFFYFASLEWLRHVSYFGWAFVAVFQGSYFGLFGLFVRWFWKRRSFLLSLFGLPSVWTVLEWIRTEIPIWAFGWNLIAYSQSQNLTLARLASWFGAYGISWLVVLINTALFFILRRYLEPGGQNLKLARFSIAALAGCAGLVFIFNLTEASHNFPQKSLGRIAVIQSNIAQEDKWVPEKKISILEIHEGLSRFAAYDRPDLIIWPEAAYPGYFNVDDNRSRIFSLVSELKTPILFGSPHLESGFPEIAFNSAYLVIPGSDALERYDKIRLVPFGEYVPWSFLLRPIGLERLAYSLGVSDFYAGSKMHVFSPSSGNIGKFSVLICFEDIFPELARDAVGQGAQFLVVITNDAWFGKSAAPYQHLQASVFRAIENGVPVVRSANTGISGFVGDSGEVLDRVKDEKGRNIFVGGGLVREVTGAHGVTWYRRGGYYFPVVCLVFLMLTMGYGFFSSRNFTAA